MGIPIFGLFHTPIKLRTLQKSIFKDKENVPYSENYKSNEIP